MKKVVSEHKKHKKELHPLYDYIRQTEKKRKSEYENFLETASENLSIPKDVIARQSMISMVGNHEITISNYHAIKEYSIQCIILLLHKKTIIIQGEHLMIEYSHKDEIKIVGNISNISFVR